jgi:hypothetical protein
MPSSERYLQFTRADYRIFEKEFVEIAQPKKQ